MQRTRLSTPPRRGATAPIVALLIIPVMGMIAFSVDVGYMIVVRTELQNAADAAALAGAEQLMNPYVQYYTAANASNQSTIYANAISAAKSTAKSVAYNNTAGGVGVHLQDGSPNYDVIAGYYDGSIFTASPGTWQTGTTFPNSVQVTARRDSTGDSTSTNGAVNLFFGPVFGLKSSNQQAFARATTYVMQSITGFQDVSSLHANMIPATFDVAVWQNYIQNGSITGTGSQYAGTAVGTDANGNSMLQVYNSNKSVGNFGALPLNAVNTGDLKSQVITGMTQTMLDTLNLQNSVTSTPVIPLAPFNMSTLQPVNNTVPTGDHDPGVAPATQSATGPYGSWNWTGQSGFIASNASTVNNYPGVYLLPLFRAVDDGQNNGTSTLGSPFSSSNYSAGLGNGSNYYYNIVDFVAVQLMPGIGQTNKQVWVEPSAMVLTFDQVTGTPPTIAGPPTSGSLNTIFVAPRLTQ